MEKIFGLHSVTAALRSGRECRQLWLQDNRRDARLNDIESRAQKLGVAVQRVSRKDLDQLAGDTHHQGVIGEFGAAVGPDNLDELLDSLNEPPFLLVLDGVQDPHNLGACLRTAAAAGVHAVIAPKDRACGITPVVRKVAAGAAEILPFFAVTNLARTLKDLKDRGIWLAGAAGDAEQTIYALDLKGPLAIVMGAEGEGLRRLTRETCDWLAKLPMTEKVESLNVSVATGICLFEAVRQRTIVGK
ncbi:MAG TPA: 23S rRNA (guanosine(2251)-2'-O)-methyltransferase RlmB [Gammaproteobacteria bacterium]